jgi:hypothetical protein
MVNGARFSIPQVPGLARAVFLAKPVRVSRSRKSFPRAEPGNSNTSPHAKPLTEAAKAPLHKVPVGRMAAAPCARCGPSRLKRAWGGGKSGLHGNTAPDNVRRGQPQGKCHRKQTAFRSLKQRISGPMASSSAERDRPKRKVRVKGCGKSAPRPWQQSRQGKPRREQNRIGTAQGRPGWLLEAPGNRRPR